MRIFPHWNPNSKCPICGTNEDKECVLIPIVGTEKDGICEAKPVHLDCINLAWQGIDNKVIIFNNLNRNKRIK